MAVRRIAVPLAFGTALQGALRCQRASRSSCGYYLADRGTDLRTMQDYLGHRDPRHTVHYTRVSGPYFVGMTRFGSHVVSGGNSVHSASANSIVRKIGH